MAPKYGEPKKPTYQCLQELAFLTFEVEWRKIRIEDSLEEDLEEDLDCVLHCCLEEVDLHWGLDELVWLLGWDID
jgi:hypothetical protein